VLLERIFLDGQKARQSKCTAKKRAFEELRARRQAKQQTADDSQRPTTSQNARDSTPEATRKEDLESVQDQGLTKDNTTAGNNGESSTAHRAHTLVWTRWWWCSFDFGGLDLGVTTPFIRPNYQRLASISEGRATAKLALRFQSTYR
jgi:hypothetical protein